MNTLSRCGVAALLIVSSSVAAGGVRVIGTTGEVSGNAQTSSVDMAFTDAQGGSVDAPQGGFSLAANAVAFITCGDAAMGSAYAGLTVNPTSLRIEGQANCQTMSFGTALIADSSARSDLIVRFAVDSPMKWSLPVGWLGMDGGTSSFVLRRAGTAIVLFDSRVGDWHTAKGVLAAGDYELETACFSSAALSVTGGPDQFVSSFGSAYYDIMVELKNSATAPRRVDVNLDGFTDYTDFDAFVAAFESGASLSDFNADGFIDFADFGEFVAAFEDAQ